MNYDRTVSGMTEEQPAIKDDLHESIAEAVQRVWGYDELRPMQLKAIRAGVEGRDALTVLPTGGGKSLCYQVPPLRIEMEASWNGTR